MRRSIAARLAEAKQTIPHFYLTADVEVERLVALRRRPMPPRCRMPMASPRSSCRSTTSSSKPGAGARPGAGRQRRVGGGSHPALPARRYRRRGGGRGRPAHAGGPRRGEQTLARDFRRDEGFRRRARSCANSSPRNWRAAPAPSPISACMASASSAPLSIRPTLRSSRSEPAARRPVEAADGGVRFVSQMTVTLSCDNRVVDGAAGAGCWRRSGIESSTRSG